jgi:hypothetical protein
LLSNLLRVPTCTVCVVTRLVFFLDVFFLLGMAIITFPPSKNAVPCSVFLRRVASERE